MVVIVMMMRLFVWMVVVAMVVVRMLGRTGVVRRVALRFTTVLTAAVCLASSFHDRGCTFVRSLCVGQHKKKHRSTCPE